jgi:hypothetical protein
LKSETWFVFEIIIRTCKKVKVIRLKVGFFFLRLLIVVNQVSSCSVREEWIRRDIIMVVH